MPYNPYINIPAYTDTLPDQSALLSPAYQNPYFFSGAGPTPAPYYNPFQGAYSSQDGIPVIPAPEVEPEKEIQTAKRIVQDDNNDSSFEAVQGGWSTVDEVNAAIESGWYGTYADARAAKNNPKASKFTEIVDKAFTDRGRKADPFAINPNANKINPLGIASLIGRGVQELGLMNAYGSGAIGTGDPVIGNPNQQLSSATIQAGYNPDGTLGYSNDANTSGPSTDHGDTSGAVGSSGDLNENYSENNPSEGVGESGPSGQGDSGDYGHAFNKGGKVMPYYNMGGLIYRQEGGDIPAVGPEGVNPALQQAAPPPQAAPMPQPMPIPAAPTRVSFAEKVANAKKIIDQNKSMGNPLPTPMPAAPMADAEGDGGVMGDVTYSDVPVGPDMGTDTVDAKLTPGEFVMNKEATEMYGPEIEKMNQDGLIARANGGSVYKEDGGYISKLDKLITLDPSNAERWRTIKTKYFADGTAEPVQSPLQNHIDSGALNKFGKSLVAIGQRDFQGASDALDGAGSAADKAKRDAELKGQQVQSSTQETYELGYGKDLQYFYKVSLVYKNGSTDTKFYDGSNNEVQAIPPGARLSTETNIGEGQAKRWEAEVLKVERDNTNGVAAASSLADKAKRVQDLIVNDAADLGTPATREPFIRKISRLALGGLSDLGVGTYNEGDQTDISRLEQILESQAVDVLTQMKAKGATFGAMSNAEWEKIQNQIGTVEDTLGGIYARQAAFIAQADMLIDGVNAFNNWTTKQRTENNYNEYPSTFKAAYARSPERKASLDKANSLIDAAVIKGRSINSGPEGNDSKDKTVEGASTIPNNKWDKSKLSNITKISENELPAFIDKAAYKANENKWGRDYDESGYVYQWFTGGESWLPESNSWRRANASAMIGG